jgi:hypothetical protein
MYALTPAADPGPDLDGFGYAVAIVARIKLVTPGKSAEAVAYLNDHSNDPNIPPAQAEEMQRLLAGVYAASGKPEGLVFAGDRCKDLAHFKFPVFVEGG